MKERTLSIWDICESSNYKESEHEGDLAFKIVLCPRNQLIIPRFKNRDSINASTYMQPKTPQFCNIPKI